jgi:hypothetical protein
MPGILAAGDVLDPALFNRNPPVAGVRDVKDLAQDLNRVVTRVINNDIPPEHKRNHTRLKKILRGTKWGDYASAYDPETEIIRINVPFKMKKNFLSMYKAGADYYYVQLATNKPPAGASFWATSPAARVAMQRDNLFEWVIRHEFGHSVDKLIQFTNRFSGHPRFGGWVRYRNSQGLLRDILIDLGRNDLRVSNALVMDALFNEFAQFLTKDDNTTWRKADGFRKRRQEIRLIISEYQFAGWTPLENQNWREALQKAHRLIYHAINDPWLGGNQVQHTVVNGRRYLFNSDYEEWYSCLNSAFLNRISNYQFSSPSEWFAETYAAWRGFGTAFNRLLIPPVGINRNREVVEWFDECLVDYGGLQYEDLIQNEGTPNAALREAPLPTAAQLSPGDDENDLEATVPGSWHFRVSPAFRPGNPFNPNAVPFP